MTFRSNPELVKALAKLDEAEETVKGLKADNEALAAALGELEEEIVGERAKAIEADQMRADAEREIDDLRREIEDLQDELNAADDKCDKAAAPHIEELEAARDALAAYLLSLGLPLNAMRRDTPELQALCDALSM